MRKADFNKILQLCFRYPWLSSKSDEVSSLYFDDCDSDEQREIVTELLDKVLYVSRDDYRKALYELAEDIMTTPGVDVNNVVVTSMAMDSTPDSSQPICYDLKCIFRDLNWEPVIVSSMSRLYQEVKRKPGVQFVFAVDEFVGSGKTVLSRRSFVERTFRDAGLDSPKLIFSVLVSVGASLDDLKAQGVEIVSGRTLKKAIDDYYSDERAEYLKGVVVSIEEKLSREYRGRELPSLGYGGAQAVYYREDGNTPNSVFPIFWWPLYRDESERKVLMKRATGDA